VLAPLPSISRSFLLESQKLGLIPDLSAHARNRLLVARLLQLLLSSDALLQQRVLLRDS
jgi:hypothetical protein